MIDKQILNYKIISKIGEGGMTKVYEAVHLKLNTKVAIKIFDPILTRRENIKQRFENEAKIMASLRHQNITQVIDFDDKDDTLALVLEMLEGENLSDYIKRKGALSIKEALSFFYQMLDAFAFAHQNKIVHRDVKPSNIFIVNNKNVKVLDFGIAKILTGSSNLTETGTQMGTPTYMSPEQVRDAKDIDLRTDIYSLAVILYFMLNGNPVYDTATDTNFDIKTKIVNEKLPTLEKYPEIDKIIQKATSKNREDRYQTCEEFMFELQNIGENQTPKKDEPISEADISEKNNVDNEKQLVKNADKPAEIIKETEKTVITPNSQEKIAETNETEIPPQKNKKKRKSLLLFILIPIVVITLLGLFSYFFFDFSELVITQEWQTVIDDNSNQKARSVIVTDDNEYIISGESYTDNLDIYVCKLDENGEVIWEEFFGNERGNVSLSVINAHDDSYLVSGGFYTNDRSADFWIMNLDEDGDVVFDVKFGSSLLWEEPTTACKHDDGYVVVGFVESVDNDFYIVNIDKNGELIWKKQYGTDADEIARAVIQTDDNDFIIVGTSTDNSVKTGYWLKLDAEGNLLQSILFESDDEIEIKSIIENDDNDNFFIAGSKDSQAWIAEVTEDGEIVNEKTFDISSESVVKQITNAKNKTILFACNDLSDDDVETHIFKTDYNFTLVWEAIDFDNDNKVFSIAEDNNSNIVFVGCQDNNDDNTDIVVTKLSEGSVFKIKKKSNNKVETKTYVDTDSESVDADMTDEKMIVGKWKMDYVIITNESDFMEEFAMSYSEFEDFKIELEQSVDNLELSFYKDGSLTTTDSYKKEYWSVSNNILSIDYDRFEIEELDNEVFVFLVETYYYMNLRRAENE